MVFSHENGYIAECIDLNLAVFRPTPEGAIAELKQAMRGYLELALGGCPAELIPRRSPLSHRLRFLLMQVRSMFPQMNNRGGWQWEVSSRQLEAR